MRKLYALFVAASLFGLALAVLLPSDAPQVSAKPPKPPKAKAPKAAKSHKTPKLAKRPKPSGAAKHHKQKPSTAAKQNNQKSSTAPKQNNQKSSTAPKQNKQKAAKTHASPRNAASKRMPEPQKKSNAQLAGALRALKASHAMLAKGDHDYGGHRKNAERDVGKAEKSLDAALGLKGDKRKKALAPRKHEPWHPESQAKSNAQLQSQIKSLQQGIAVLQKGDRDYGGNRVQAIKDMQASIAQLQKAMQSAHK